MLLILISAKSVYAYQYLIPSEFRKLDGHSSYWKELKKLFLFKKQLRFWRSLMIWLEVFKWKILLRIFSQFMNNLPTSYQTNKHPKQYPSCLNPSHSHIAYWHWLVVGIQELITSTCYSRNACSRRYKIEIVNKKREDRRQIKNSRSGLIDDCVMMRVMSPKNSHDYCHRQAMFTYHWKSCVVLRESRIHFKENCVVYDATHVVNKSISERWISRSSRI